MKINSNITALYANRSLELSNQRADKSMTRLTTGMRLNNVKDDAAGMAISTKLRSQVNALNMSNRNSMDGISLVQTTEGALGEVHEMLRRMRELAVQSANDTLTSDDRDKIATEVKMLTEEISATANRTEFNRINLLSHPDTKLFLQIGGGEGMELGVDLPKTTAETLEIVSAIEMVRTGDPMAIDKFDAAISLVSLHRSTLGAYQNRLEHTVANLEGASVNIAQSLSRVADTDMAVEMSEYTKSNVVSQAAIAMLAQANARPEQMLQLLR